MPSDTGAAVKPYYELIAYLDAPDLPDLIVRAQKAAAQAGLTSEGPFGGEDFFRFIYEFAVKAGAKVVMP